MKKFCTVCREERDMTEREEKYSGSVRERTINVNGVKDGTPVITCENHSFGEWKVAQDNFKIDTI